MEFIYTAINAQGERIQEKIIAESENSALNRLHQTGMVIISLNPLDAKGNVVASAKPKITLPSKTAKTGKPASSKEKPKAGEEDFTSRLTQFLKTGVMRKPPETQTDPQIPGIPGGSRAGGMGGSDIGGTGEGSGYSASPNTNYGAMPSGMSSQGLTGGLGGGYMRPPSSGSRPVYGRPKSSTKETDKKDEKKKKPEVEKAEKKAKPKNSFFTLSLSNRRPSKVKLDQIVTLSREFAIMIETGVPLIEAVEGLEEHTKNILIKEALAEMKIDLSEGKTLSQAIEKHTKLFPSLYVDMVRAAEAGARLDETLNRAADYMEAALEMRRKVVGALTYPAILALVSICVLLFIMLYMLPKFSEMFTQMGAQLPAQTVFLIAVSDFLKARWYTIPFFGYGSFWLLKRAWNTPAGRLNITRILHRIPMVGDMIRRIALARILRVLGTLLAAGVGLLESLDTAARTGQDVIFEQAMFRLRGRVQDGHAMSDSFIETNVFPPTVCQMVAVGEKSGQLSEVLVRVAGYYERDVDARLKVLASVIEPVMIIVLGVVVGFIVVSIIVPIYALMGSVK